MSVAHRRLRRRGCRGLDPQYFDKYFIFFPSAELLNTASRCHFHLQCAQCTGDAKFINLLGRGTAPPRPHPSPPTAPQFSRLRRSTCDPRNVPVELTPMGDIRTERQTDRQYTLITILRSPARGGVVRSVHSTRTELGGFDPDSQLHAGV